MNFLQKFALLLLILSSLNAHAQKQCSFTMDTLKIVLNENIKGFLTKLKTESFIKYNDKDRIPLFIKKELECLKGGFSLANPDEEYFCCCTSSQKLPKHKLRYLALSNDILILTYLTGGIGESTRILLIQFKNEEITDFWTTSCFKDLKSKRNIIHFIQDNYTKKDQINYGPYNF